MYVILSLNVRRGKYMQNLTEGKPLKQFTLFLIPVLIGNILNQLYSVVDTLMVGKIIGSDALAAVGATAGALQLINGFVGGLSVGVTIITAKYIGSRDTIKARSSIAQCYLISIFFSVLFAVLGILLTVPLLNLIKTPQDVLIDAAWYLKITFSGLFAVIIYGTTCNIARSLGDSRTPLYFIIIGSFLNILFDYLFIAVFKWGVIGASLATILVQYISAIACFVYVYFKHEYFRLKRNDFKFTFKDLSEHFTQGFSVGFQNSIIGASKIIFQIALNTYGVAYIAAFTAEVKLEMFLHMPNISVGSALITFISQNVGATKYDRVRRGFTIGFLMNSAVAIICTVLALLFPAQLMSIFVKKADTQVIDIAVGYIRIIAPWFFFASLLMTVRTFLQGLGKGSFAALGGLMEFVMCFIASVYLSNLFGFTGLSYAYPLSWIGALIPQIVAMIIYMKKLPKV